MRKGQQQWFPPSLLAEDAAKKKKFFDDFIAAHPIMDDVLKRLLIAIEDADCDSMIYVYGPSGAGKSTLRDKVATVLTENLLPELQTDTSRLSVISVRLKAPMPPAFFNWGNNFARLLYAANEPLVERKIHPDEVKSDVGKRIPSRQDASANALQLSYEKLLQYRRPTAVLLDEAQVIVNSSSTRLTHQLDVIKSVAADSGVPHILFGTYRLLEVRNLDGQIARRSTDIHFRRYSNMGDDYQQFVNTVGSLALAMPFTEPPDLMGFVDLLHEKSAGCIGLLKPWLFRAYSLALRQNASTVTLEHIEESVLSEDKLAVIFDEIFNGEIAMQEAVDKYATSFNSLFGKQELEAETTDSREKAKEQGQARIKNKPGVRKANRDQIGSAVDPTYRGKRAKSA